MFAIDTQTLFEQLQIVVSVLDVNDNSPLFEKSVYNTSLAEDTEVGTCFLKVGLLFYIVHCVVQRCRAFSVTLATRGTRQSPVVS